MESSFSEKLPDMAKNSAWIFNLLRNFLYNVNTELKLQYTAHLF